MSELTKLTSGAVTLGKAIEAEVKTEATPANVSKLKSFLLSLPAKAIALYTKVKTMNPLTMLSGVAIRALVIAVVSMVALTGAYFKGKEAADVACAKASAAAIVKSLDSHEAIKEKVNKMSPAEVDKALKQFERN